MTDRSTTLSVPPAALPTSGRSPRLKIALISHTAELGGAERVLVELAEGLRAKGADCLVVLPMAGPLAARFAQIGVRCVVVKYSWWSNQTHRLRRGARNLLAVASLARLFRRERVDIVYTNTMMVPSGAVAAKLCGLPHIWHVHEFGQDDHELRFDIGDKFGRRLVGALSDKVICVSKAVEERLVPYVAPEKLTTVYATVTLRESDVAPPPRPDRAAVNCVLVGVLRPSKGQTDAIAAIEILAGEGIDISLTLVGGGAIEPDIRRILAEKGLEHRVRLTGHVDNPFPFVEEADISLMCSRCEAFARAVMEAMMLGKPIVGSRSGGTVEAVRDHFNGLLYTPGDVGDLTDKIRILAKDLDYARKLGENGKRWSRETFTIDHFVGGVMEHVHAALAARSAPRRTA